MATPSTSLGKCARAFLKKWGAPTHLIYRNSIEDFAESSVGARQANSRMVFVSLDDKNVIWELEHASRVILPFFVESMLPLLTLWLDRVGSVAPFEVFVSPEQADNARTLLGGLPRAQDSIKVLDFHSL